MKTGINTWCLIMFSMAVQPSQRKSNHCLQKAQKAATVDYTTELTLLPRTGSYENKIPTVLQNCRRNLQNASEIPCTTYTNWKRQDLPITSNMSFSMMPSKRRNCGKQFNSSSKTWHCEKNGQHKSYRRCRTGFAVTTRNLVRTEFCRIHCWNLEHVSATCCSTYTTWKYRDLSCTSKKLPFWITPPKTKTLPKTIQ